MAEPFWSTASDNCAQTESFHFESLCARSRSLTWNGVDESAP
jgi:hypothetical protein